MRTLAILAITTLAACTTTQEIARPGGQKELLVACGTLSGWNVCYNRANELCPSGYTELEKMNSLSRKEMRISCK